jgi:hypothetical protein
MTGFYQALIGNNSEVEIWFIGAMLGIFILLVGIVMFLVVKGKKPPSKETPAPVSRLRDEVSGTSREIEE